MTTYRYRELQPRVCSLAQCSGEEQLQLHWLHAPVARGVPSADKLEAWRLIQYDFILFVDADITFVLINRSLDGVATLRTQVDETSRRAVAFATPAVGADAAQTIAQQPAATPPDLDAAFARFRIHT